MREPQERPPLQVVITGASSGLGLAAAKSLAQQGWQVVMACRDFQKAEKAAKEAGMDPETYQARRSLDIRPSFTCIYNMI